jgi:hypothetical protein
MRNSSHCLYLTLLLVITTTNVVFGQAKKTGYFKYGLISYEIIYSPEFQDTIGNKTIFSLIDHLHAEVYFNTSWVVVLNKYNDRLNKSMYNRKSRVLYSFYDDPLRKSLRIDSIFAFYEQDSKLLAARDTLRHLMGITISQGEVSLINGLKCHKEYFTQEFPEGQTVDEIWVTSFLKVPNLIFNDHLYALNEGIPLKIVQDFLDFKITWGVVEFLPLSRKDKIFTFDKSEYSVKVFDSKSLIYQGIHFIRTHEPKQKSH